MTAGRGVIRRPLWVMLALGLWVAPAMVQTLEEFDRVLRLEPSAADARRVRCDSLLALVERAVERLNRARTPVSAMLGVTGTLLVEQPFTPTWRGDERMKTQKTYTALLTADLAAAEGWYTKLLGRGPDFRPMSTLVQWELFDQGGVMVSTSSEIAGKGVMFVIVDDVAAERRRLKSLGIVLGDDIEGDYSTLAPVRDPDGNLIMLATPPSRPYPPA